MFLELDSLESLDSYIRHEFTRTYESVVETAEICMMDPSKIDEYHNPYLKKANEKYVKNYELYKQFYDDLMLIHKAIKERIEENKKQRDKIKEVLEILNIATKDDY